MLITITKHNGYISLSYFCMPINPKNHAHKSPARQRGRGKALGRRGRVKWPAYSTWFSSTTFRAWRTHSKFQRTLLEPGGVQPPSILQIQGSRRFTVPCWRQPKELSVISTLLFTPSSRLAFLLPLISSLFQSVKRFWLLFVRLQCLKARQLIFFHCSGASWFLLCSANAYFVLVGVLLGQWPR